LLAAGGAFIAAGGAFVVAGGAFAQGRPAADAGEEDGGDDVDRVALEDYADEAGKAIAAMRAAMEKGLDEVKTAREEKDAVRLTCVNGPVTTMKGLLRVGDEANNALLEALGTSNTSDARREFRKLKKSQLRMAALLRQAETCAGAVSSESTTSTELAIDDELVNNDPYYGNGDFFFDPQDAVAEGDTNSLGQQDDITVRPPPASGVS
jgi:hypothetical protein